MNDFEKIDGGVFYKTNPDGTLSDKGVVDNMLDKEDELRQELINKGIISNITLVRKQKEKDKGVFFAVDEQGNPADKGIVDGMLDNDAEITQQLSEAGIIKQYYAGDKKEKE